MVRRRAIAAAAGWRSQTSSEATPQYGPTAPPIELSGADSDFLDSPFTALATVQAEYPDKSNFVTVTSGTSLASATNAQPAGTVFYIVGTNTTQQVMAKNGNVYIGAPGAAIDGTHTEDYACGGNSTDVVWRYVEIRNYLCGRDNGPNPTSWTFYDEFSANHDGGHGWVFDHCYLHDCGGALLGMGSSNIVRYTYLDKGGQYGLSMWKPEVDTGTYGTAGIVNHLVDHCELSHNNLDDWENGTLHPGANFGITGGTKFWQVTHADITNNYVHHNYSVGIWADTGNADFSFVNNYIAHNDAEGVFYEISYNAEFLHNTFIGNNIVKGPDNGGFVNSAIYMSESGHDSRLPGPSNSGEIAYNTFTNNYGDITLYENADRYAMSPANTSTGFGTFVGPHAKDQVCVPTLINGAPYFDDCRWKTANNEIHHNVFTFDESVLPGDTAAGGIGMFSNYGTYPAWSPYEAFSVADALTYDQNNVFHDNTYRLKSTTRYRFMVHEQGNRVNLTQWRANPYAQDSGSTLEVI